jgi:hypothetical protein
MANPAPAPQVKEKFTFGKTYTFRLRQHHGDNFAGLWELAILNKMNHPIKVISDADALNFCMENLMGELENDGF